MATKIEIDLEDLGWSYNADGEAEQGPPLAALVVDGIVRKMLDGGEFERTVKATVSAVIENETTDRVRALVEETLAGPITLTTPWGEKRSEPTTVLEIIRTKVDEFMKTPKRDRYSTSNEPRNLSEIIEASVRSALDRELLGAVNEAKATIRERVTDAALRAAVEALAK
jgi:hypothetical protein